MTSHTLATAIFDKLVEEGHLDPCSYGDVQRNAVVITDIAKVIDAEVFKDISRRQAVVGVEGTQP